MTDNGPLSPKFELYVLIHNQPTNQPIEEMAFWMLLRLMTYVNGFLKFKLDRLYTCNISCENLTILL